MCVAKIYGPVSDRTYNMIRVRDRNMRELNLPQLKFSDFTMVTDYQNWNLTNMIYAVTNARREGAPMIWAGTIRNNTSDEEYMLVKLGARIVKCERTVELRERKKQKV